MEDSGGRMGNIPERKYYTQNSRKGKNVKEIKKDKMQKRGVRRE